MRIGVAATPEVAIPTLNWFLESEHTLELVVTQPDKPAGRGREIKQTVVADWASSHNIPIIKPGLSDELRGVIDDLDCVVTIGYGVLLPEHILALPRYGFINLHFSLLPAYRGAAPAQRALENGETVTGVTVFQLEKGMDTGPIYSQHSIAIDPTWRSVELLEELAKLGPSTMSQALAMIATGERPTPQTGNATLAPKISKQEALLDFSKDSKNLINSIRAFTYEPGAWCMWKGEPFKITSAVSTQTYELAPGEISVNENRVLVGCAKNTTIEMLTVVPAGKKEMNAADWARGARLQGGECFG